MRTALPNEPSEMRGFD